MTAWKHLSVLVVAFVATFFLTDRAFSSTVGGLADDDETWSDCARAAHVVEREEQAPELILAALTLIESGRRAPGGSVKAWPWTIYARGRGHYFASKEAAITEVRRLRAAGVTAIDVGCAQINLHYHPDAFATLEDAFDPVANVSYALQFLSSLRTRYGSWEAAVANYHSVNPKHQGVYRTRVISAWLRAERESAEFWHKSDLYPAPKGSPGNSASLGSDAATEPELAQRESQRPWTRWEALTARARKALGLALFAPIPRRPRFPLPSHLELALDFGPRPRTKTKRRRGARHPAGAGFPSARP